MVVQLCQILWTAAFREKYLEKASNTLIAPILLTLTAYALSRVHRVYSLSQPFDNASYIYFGLSMSLLFSWTCVASLISWNHSIYTILCRDPEHWKKKGQESSLAVMRWLGHGSAVLASILGIGCTLARRAPVFGAVLSWALFACADNMQQWRLDEKPSVQKKDIDLQFRLCYVGGILSILAYAFMGTTIAAKSLQAARP